MAIDVETTVSERYAQGAQERQAALCCPVEYDSELLEMLPREIVERDYGCGDPSRYVRPGDVVLDLGCGGGKVCYMAAQLTGPAGQVIGVDMNDAMLALARRHQAEMARRLGGDRVRFLKGYIQDLALDMEALTGHLAANPVSGPAGYSALRDWERRQRREAPLIPDASIDLVISNCVLNLVDDTDKPQLVREIFRVLRPGGRIAISDIVSDRPVPAALKEDPELWSGCIAGAFEESGFLDAFAGGGFRGVRYDKWDPQPWRVIDGISFRAVTLTAVKPACRATQPASRTLMYRGPFAAVVEEDGRQFRRGQRETVPAQTHELLLGPAFAEAFIDPEAAPAPAAGAGCCGGASTTDRPDPGTQGQSHGGCCS